MPVWFLVISSHTGHLVLDIIEKDFWPFKRSHSIITSAAYISHRSFAYMWIGVGMTITVHGKIAYDTPIHLVFQMLWICMSVGPDVSSSNEHRMIFLVLLRTARTIVSASNHVLCESHAVDAPAHSISHRRCCIRKWISRIVYKWNNNK